MTNFSPKEETEGVVGQIILGCLLDGINFLIDSLSLYVGVRY